MTKKDNYLKRQVHILSNIGLFYLIILAFFAIPLLGAFVVILIKGISDFRHAILIGGGLILLLALFGLTQFVRSTFRKIRQDGFAANEEARERASRGEPVQISVFNGLLTLTYGGERHANAALPYRQDGAETPVQLPCTTEQRSDLITQLKTLSDLKNQGAITEDEFEIIKARLIHEDQVF